MKLFAGKSLQFRLSIQVALLAILPMLVMSWVAGNFLVENIRSESIRNVGTAADAKYERLNMLLSKANMRASSFLSSLGTECLSPSGKLDKTCAAKLINLYLTSESATGAELYKVMSSEKLSVGISIDRDDKASTFQTGQLAKFSGNGPENNRTFFISVADPSKGLQLEILYPSTILDPIFDRPSALGDSGETFLADGEGYFVTPARYPSTQGQNHPISARPMQLCLSGKNREVLDLDYRDHPIIHGFRFIPELGSACIMAHIDQAEAFASASTFAKRLTIAMVAFTLLVVLFVMHMARSIAKPITKLTDELSKSESQLRLLLDSAAEAVCGIDLQGNFTFCNPSCLKMLGYKHADELTGKNIHQLIHYKHPDGTPFPVGDCRIIRALGEGEPIHLDDEVFWRADGTPFPAECWSHPQFSDGVVVGAVVTFLDISERKQSQEKLLKLSRAVENSPASVVITDVNGTIEYVNKRFTAVTGYSAEEAIGQNPRILNAGIQTTEFYREMWETLLAGNEWQGEIYNKKKNGEIYLEHALISPIRDENEFIAHFVAVKEDITERKRVADELQKADKDKALLEKESQYRMAIDTAEDGFWMLDAQGRLLQVNDAYARLSGYSRDELLNMGIPDLEAQERHEEAAAHIVKIMREGTDQFESRHRRKDGSIWPVQISATYTPAAGGRLFVFITDLTEHKQAEQKMLYLAHYDGLTGLPNRTLFHDRLEQEIKKAHRAGLKMALLFIDLDRFKEVNDTLGHSMGDILLVEAAHRIGDCVRDTDTVARLGGDEFIIILSELDEASSIERVAENILQQLAKPFQLGDEVAHVSASIGITLYPDDATEVEELLKDADQAMYVAKNAGRNRLSYFTPALQQAAQTRLQLLNDLRGALAGGQFRVYFQPIVELATGRIHKAEALIRWQHPQRGMVSPAQFIPLAEDSGLIVEIGDWVFKEAARQVKRWRALHDTGFQISMNMPSHADFQISVNVSPVQFHHAGSLYQTWRTYLQELELPGESMVIEITEGLLLETDSSVTDKLLEFHDVGIQVSIDDFGTGYSSLSYLKKFDIDYLKIDQSFVRNLATDPNDMALSEAIIVMAHKLGLKVIAEGVETAAQRELLVAAGCDYAQGYLYSRPVPAAEFEALLEATRLQFQR